MIKSSLSRSAIAPLLAVVLLSQLSHISAAQSAPRLDYTLGITDASRHLFHIKIQASNVRARTIEISMPSWTPGWYTIRPYAANVIKLQAHAGGKRLPMRAIDKQTWRIETLDNRTFTVEYDYFADNLDVNGAELTQQRGYFLGTNLFFYVPGHTTGTPSTLKFEIPENWRIATGLKRANEKNTYQARDFDNLVDCPTVIGDFDDYTTTALDKTIHLVIDPKGQMTAEAAGKLKEYVSRVIESQGKMFGGLPYDEYWVLYVAGKLRGGGALEHENSTNIMLRAVPPDPRSLIGVTSHEHFHVWNVKRIKPAALMPYDYSKEQYTGELWFAEGFTNYYGDLHIRRAGINTVEDYLGGLAMKVRNLEFSEARKWVSLSDSSTITWLTYGGTEAGFTNFSTNYYNKGELVGLLLDLEIRGVTRNEKSLDDVMRYLFENFYKRGRGYTNEDVMKIASEIAGRSLKDLFDRYVNGTNDLDYDAGLKHAGYRLQEGKVVNVENVTATQQALRKSWLGE